MYILSNTCDSVYFSVYYSDNIVFIDMYLHSISRIYETDSGTNFSHRWRQYVNSFRNMDACKIH